MEEEDEDEGGWAISLHAIKGMVDSKIIKVEGKVQKSILMVLIDSGSTHSFIDEGTARKMKWPLASTQPPSVTVANGNRVITNPLAWDFVEKCKEKTTKLT